jgi:serine/threonine protein kinase
MSKRDISNYRILKEIGRGGMATVYLAEDLRLHRQVALKLLPFQLTQDSTFKERFKREARMIAALKHEAIVPVHDFGEVDGQPFIVLEYMPGGSLANRLQEGKLSLDEAIQIIEQLVPALEEAHHKGIIHRDLKPGNILFDERGNAHLSDFGIASFVDASASMASLTGTGLVGTPAYMSPEQAIGKEKIDSRSDVYSLGIVLYEMLSGSKPFAADTPVGLLLAQMNDPIPNVRKKQPSLPKNTQVVIERVLAKNKRDRYSSPRDLLADLKRVINRKMVVPIKVKRILTAFSITMLVGFTGMLYASTTRLNPSSMLSLSQQQFSSTLTIISPIPTESPTLRLPTPTISPTLPLMIVVSGDQVNIRSGPGSEYSVVSVASNGSQYQAIGTFPGWVIVQINDTEGWLPEEYVTVGAVLDGLPTIVPPPTSTPPESITVTMDNGLVGFIALVIDGTTYNAKSGQVKSFTIQGGWHTVTVRAWDNSSASGILECNLGRLNFTRDVYWRPQNNKVICNSFSP